MENFDKVVEYFKQSADAKYYKALISRDEGNEKEALSFVEEALTDFKSGYFNNRPYVETLRQIYLEDLLELKESILQRN